MSWSRAGLPSVAMETQSTVDRSVSCPNLRCWRRLPGDLCFKYLKQVRSVSVPGRNIHDDRKVSALSGYVNVVPGSYMFFDGDGKDGPLIIDV